jgi:hypothetical protein
MLALLEITGPGETASRGPNILTYYNLNVVKNSGVSH